jgi:anaerobic selenocysteine-containing dehydrogenase
VHRELCGTTSWLGAAKVLGRPFGVDPESLRHSRTLVLWGTNTRITNRHFWPVVEEARANGATVVVVDPVRTDTAREADVFVQPRPGTDVALVLGLVHVLHRDGLLDPTWLAEHTTAGTTSETRGVDPSAPGRDRRRRRARGVAGAPHGDRAAHRARLIGPEHRGNGTEISARYDAHGKLGRGATSAAAARSTQQWAFSALAPRATGRCAAPSTWRAWAGTTSRTTTPTSICCSCFEPGLVVPDQNRVIAGLERDLFTVVVEQFVTDTARYADIVLPATTQIEHSTSRTVRAPHRPQPAGDRTARRALPSTGSPGVSRPRSGSTTPRCTAATRSWCALLDSDHLPRGITYERLAAEGWAHLAVPGRAAHVDLNPRGAGRPMRLGRLTRRRRPRRATDLVRRFPLAWSRASAPEVPQHELRRLPRAPRAAAGRLSDPPGRRDGAGRNERRTRANDRGAITLAAEVTDDLQPGLVAIPFGWWNRSTPEGRAVNALTNPCVPDDDRGSAFFHDTLVQVTPVPTAEQPAHDGAAMLSS